MNSHTYTDPENKVWRVKVLRDCFHHSVECLREDGKIVSIQDNRLEPLNCLTGTFIHRDGSVKACRFIREMTGGNIQVAYVDGSGNRQRGSIRRNEFKPDSQVIDAQPVEQSKQP